MVLPQQLLSQEAGAARHLAGSPGGGGEDDGVEADEEGSGAELHESGREDFGVDEEGSDEETETPAVESIVDDSDESGNEEPEIVRPQRKKRKLLKDKLICNLEEALNPDNYDR